MWPDSIVTIVWPGYQMGSDSTVRRTSLEDGAVRQAVTVAKALATWTFTANVSLNNVAAFQTWLRANGDGWFTMNDLRLPGQSAATQRSVRIRGGQGSVTLASVQSDVRLNNNRYMSATITVEGFV